VDTKYSMISKVIFYKNAKSKCVRVEITREDGSIKVLDCSQNKFNKKLKRICRELTYSYGTDELEDIVSIKAVPSIKNLIFNKKTLALLVSGFILVTGVGVKKVENNFSKVKVPIYTSLQEGPFNLSDYMSQSINDISKSK